jgi:MYXO-CTERM domain-containing protein
MKMIFTASLLLLGSFAAVGQTQQPTAADSIETQTNTPGLHHNYGWIGLIGLAGLLGLRRQKSIEHQRMAASGISVKTVDAT